MTGLSLKHKKCGTVLVLRFGKLLCLKCRVSVEREDRDPPHSVTYTDDDGKGVDL